MIPSGAAEQVKPTALWLQHVAKQRMEMLSSANPDDLFSGGSLYRSFSWRISANWSCRRDRNADARALSFCTGRQEIQLPSQQAAEFQLPAQVFEAPGRYKRTLEPDYAGHSHPRSSAQVTSQVALRSWCTLCDEYEIDSGDPPNACNPKSRLETWKHSNIMIGMTIRCTRVSGLGGGTSIACSTAARTRSSLRRDTKLSLLCTDIMSFSGLPVRELG